jgi:hypothetical protein
MKIRWKYVWRRRKLFSQALQTRSCALSIDKLSQSKQAQKVKENRKQARRNSN